MSILRDDIFTLDNFFHFLLGCLVLASAYIYLPFAASWGLYLREGGQWRGSHPEDGLWGEIWMRGSVHKHAEWLVPSIVIAVLWEALRWLNILPV